ncbi:MAG: hypothetical protein JXA96_00105 [Sedimentisphaerales bacterium]|nr:hypothetical protein [Sedimentisphaerales bacterium]
MSERIEEKVISERPNIFLRVIYIILFLIITSVIIWRIFYYNSPEEQLAEIEVSIAIPDSENAAIIYNQLIEDYTESYLKPAFLTLTIDDITRQTPWTSEDYPEAAEWLEENEDIFTKLIEASKYEHCLFPIAINSLEDMDNIMSHLSFIRQLAFWLMRSANYDFGEGRTDQAMEKYICCINMGRHFRQQPVAIVFLVGIAMESLGLQRTQSFIMNENTTTEQIKTIETSLLDKKFEFDKYWTFMLHVENLNSKTLPTTTANNFLERLKELWLSRKNDEAAMKRVKEIYLRLLTDRQGTQILVALRQYKNKNGKWPEKLDEVKPFLSSENILIDPQNDSSFVYKLKDGDFVLYSTGLNGIDENGQKKSPADDWPIWPLDTPQIQSQNTKTTRNDPNNVE